MDKITKRAIIWTLIIVFGGGLLSLALGQGFWGEKAQFQPDGPPGALLSDDPRGWEWGPHGPNMNVQCTNECAKCHPDK